jgi:hypothetical protein
VAVIQTITVGSMTGNILFANSTADDDWLDLELLQEELL